MFEKDKEIVFFNNKEELLEKVQYYLQHENALSEIGEKGFERVKKMVMILFRVCKRY